MAARTSASRNDYRCSIERNQSGKYCVRIQVHYPRHAWTLGTFFLASSFDRAMKKLEEALDFLQRQEEKLWFWGVDRAEGCGVAPGPPHGIPAKGYQCVLDSGARSPRFHPGTNAPRPGGIR
jgi:hypothetical protein